ncbi:cytochrome ubiquinol oxidase subunit I [Porphyromonas pogonae]|uniref:cytochrome ubiquinol oxidase subunit I n=1 Tax=Porphyromonas pogonae TaxID=867595 RepID=UPI002E76F74D|nr:cytochrome ubiquinol oxidase subunit I [Porphyromonas pogonae]
MHLEALLNWSRAQFALTAMYHWLFVPLTLGLGVIMAIAETKYYRTGETFWKESAKFWQKLFGINFAIGVATGIILEFEFGTNWSNYSWFVGDIFGAPLAIEGILAFFMEATFIAVMFFGWGKVSKGFHLTSTWLTIIGATLSAIWILIANAWMQNPVGMKFNPETVRSEMENFWAVALSPTAMVKFWHTATSCWTLGAVFALAICSWYLIRKKNVGFALRNAKMIAPFGLLAAVLTAVTGDSSAYDIAQHQPMKLAAMEALYDGGQTNAQGRNADGKGTPLSMFGILNTKKTIGNDGVDPYAFNIPFPGMLSLMATRTVDGFVPGIDNILDGGYVKQDGTVALSADSMMSRGQVAIGALKDFSEAKAKNDKVTMESSRKTLEDNFNYFGYGYLKDKSQLVPNVPMIYYSFRLMVGAGIIFILLFILTWIFASKPDKFRSQKWFHIVALFCLPLVYMASQSGWIVAEVGRQPWAIQGLLPVQAAISKLEVSSVKVTFFLFFILFTILLIAEIKIMIEAIKQGPTQENSNH